MRDIVISSRIPAEFPTVPERYKGDIFGLTIFKSDFEFLYENEKLSDTCIDTFFRIMQMTAGKRNVQVNVIPACFLISVSLGMDVSEEFKSKKNFYDTWLVPTQINRNHWILFVVFTKRQLVLVLDPLDKSGLVTGQKEMCLKVSVPLILMHLQSPLLQWKHYLKNC